MGGPSFEDLLSAGRPAPAPRLLSNVVPIHPRDDHAILELDGGAAAYVRKAIADECAELASMPPKSGRNGKLNEAAFSLRRFIDNGSIDEQTVFNALMDAANACGVLAEDGQEQCEASIRSGFKGSMAKVGARPLPTKLDDRTQVTEVDLANFGPGAGGAEPDPASSVDAFDAIFDADEAAFW